MNYDTSDSVEALMSRLEGIGQLESVSISRGPQGMIIARAVVVIPGAPGERMVSCIRLEPPKTEAVA